MLSTIAFVVVCLSAPAPTDRTAAPASVEPSAPEGAAAVEAWTPAPEVKPEAVKPEAVRPEAVRPEEARPSDPFAARVEGPPPPRVPARPERPIRWRVDVGGGVGAAVMRDTAWRAFDDGRSASQLSATLRADFRLGQGRVFLGGGVAIRRFLGGGVVYERLSTDVRVRDPLLFLRMSVVTVEGVDVFVQAGGGPSVVDMAFGSTQVASQRAVLGMIDGLAGAALYLPKQWLPRRGAARMTGGLELGAGYTWRGSLEVRPTLAVPTDPIEASAAGLGDVALRGLVWRLGLFVRFQ